MDAERAKILLYNAIVWIEEDCGNFFCNEVDDEYKWFEKTLGITKAEMLELGIDWLSHGSES